MFGKLFGKNPHIVIDSQATLEEAALYFGMLPFFRNSIRGFSVEELAAPGMLFGGNRGEEGCWEWKGPVIREQKTAYGKFFKKKAGFVSLELLPDFLNYRRAAYPVKPDSMEAMILEMIRENEGMTSTELRRAIIGSPHRRRYDENGDPLPRPKRSSLEGPLQRLQMGGWLLIADFEYKLTAKGDPYGWGVALYSTPEVWFGPELRPTRRSSLQSFDRLVSALAGKLPSASEKALVTLLR